ncbi:Response regulator receiver domain-containing protein [Lachnospiraceae bacterium XBB1006]|nr:Response regulator receiver domain-containing protein [Lachnospiraceae bacterium XBB1006]
MLEKMKIMVVDDNTVNLATVEQELKDKYEVIPMISGRRAIKYLYRERVDLILLDVQMPIMDGIDTLREIRTQPNGTTVPVIFLTSKKDKTTVIEGGKLGIMDYITKPFDSEDLQGRIERVFKRLGKLPMEEEEIFHRINGILTDVKEEHLKAAGTKMEEVLGYQINEDISGRIKNAQEKLGKGNTEGCASMLERILRMLEKNLSATKKSSALPISTGEINARLLYILDDVSNFKIRESISKVADLLRYDVPDYVATRLVVIKERLDNFDDDEAEVLVRDLLEEVKKSNAFTVGMREATAEKEKESDYSGYHYNRLL